MTGSIAHKLSADALPLSAATASPPLQVNFTRFGASAHAALAITSSAMTQTAVRIFIFVRSFRFAAPYLRAGFAAPSLSAALMRVFYFDVRLDV